MSGYNMDTERDLLDKCLADCNGKVTGVLHLGASTGQEAEIYQKHGVQRVVWVEANPELIPALKANVEPLGHQVIERAIYAENGLMKFKISNNEGSSSSLYDFGTHRQKFPHVHFIKEIEVNAITLDCLAADYGLFNETLPKINWLTMDLQGGEAAALQGGKKVLRRMDAVFTEVNFEPLYEHCGLANTLESFLSDFTCQAFRDCGVGAGDGFYVRLRASALDHRERCGRG